MVFCTTIIRGAPIQVAGLTLSVTVPDAPANLTATPGDAQVGLSWHTVTDAVYYDVKRSETTGGPYTIIFNDITGTSCTDTGLTNGITYYYVVSASNANGEGPNSNEVSATPLGMGGNRSILELAMTNGVVKNTT